ncbi:MAG: MarR family winged helix-turn-helix transcriptional regulator [Actinoallomurus sp.]
MTKTSAAKTQVTSEDEPFVAIEHELCTLLRRARAMSAEMGRQVHPDLDPEAYGLLVGIHDHARARGSDLAGYFGLSKATVSRQLKVLAELGLVEREPDPVDGRAHVLVLTAEGRQRLESTRSARREAWHTMLHSWPVGDVRLLADMLARFNVLCEAGLDA